jgi:glycosyltransferase involved in cell wall biosynthesis
MSTSPYFNWVIMSKLKSLRDIFDNICKPCDVGYIVEPAAWSIHDDGIAVTERLSELTGRVVSTPIGLRGKIWHFGSINSFYHHRTRIKKNIPCIVTWFHLVPDDPRTQDIIKCDHLVSVWHTASTRTKRQLIQAGLPEKKIVIIPLGVDHKYFFPVLQEKKNELKEIFGLPEDHVIIGSFQKDGNGWEEDSEPKLIKGPDIFCDILEELSKHMKIFALLSGPSRGYVKKRLKIAGIPFVHKLFEKSTDVSHFFQASDLYMITSREEGGPKALLESLATRTPLVTGQVGMVDDLVQDQEEALIVDWSRKGEAVEKIISLINNDEKRKSMQEKGQDSVFSYDWLSIADRYEKELYLPLI